MNSGEDKKTINGVVLAGGKSTRMGQDKGLIKWYGKEQRYYMADLLKDYCTKVFISCRPDQVPDINQNYKTIKDRYEGSGPLGAILSAFDFDPHQAWLVVACDLILLDKLTIEYLLEHRNESVLATSFESPHDRLPEPLVTIWEPAAYSTLHSYLPKGSCPRKILLNSEIEILKPPNSRALTNANTPQDVEQVKRVLYQKRVSYE